MGSLEPEESQLEAQKQAITRALRRSSRSDDLGEIDPRLATALNAEGLEEQLLKIVEVLPEIRLMMPVYPHPTPQVEENGSSQDRECPPGALTEVEFCSDYQAKAVPVYSDITRLRQAHPEARQVPVQGRTIALSVLQRPGRLVLDDYYLLPRTALNAVASGDKWLPAWKNEGFLAAVSKLCAAQPGVKIVALTPQPSRPDALVVEIEQSTLGARETLLRFQRELFNLPGLAEATDGLQLMPIPKSGS